MKTVLSSKRHHYLVKSSIFLVTLALIAGMVGCGGDGDGGESYTLTIASTAGGNVTTPGEAGPYTYDEGTVVDVVAEADEGYRFVNWTGDVGTFDDVNAATTTITMSDNCSITAEFVRQHDFTTSSTGGGSVTTPGEDTFTYDEGTVLDLVAEADACYEFIDWTGDVDTIADVYAASTTITLDAAKNVTANFAVLSYNLTADSNDSGSVADPGEGTFTYDCGTMVDLVAEAEEGYRFVNWTGDVGTIADVNDATTTITMDDNYSITANFGEELECIPMVAAGGFHTVGLKSDGTVVAVGYNDWGQCNVGGWTDIVQVAAGSLHTVGLKSDGTVVAVGGDDYGYGQCDVGGWTGIVQVTAGRHHTVGIKDDGTVVAVGWNNVGQCNVGGWTGIVQVTAGSHHTVGLKTDGTVVAVGLNEAGECDIGGWTDITQVAAGQWHTVGLKSDGTVVAVGANGDGQCDVGGWTDITQVSTGYRHTVGLKDDGTVVAVGFNVQGQCNVGSWTDITQVATKGWHTVGLKDDGTVVAVGENSYGQCNVGGWDLY